MSVWESPDEAEWCPECQRERISCVHQSEEQPIATDGGDVCGKRSCDRSPAYAIEDGPRRKSRCGRHALEELNGIGPAKAERLWAEFGNLDDLIEIAERRTSARVARLDGFSPDSLDEIRESLIDVGLLEVIEA